MNTRAPVLAFCSSSTWAGADVPALSSTCIPQLPSAFPSKVLGHGCWLLGLATPPDRHPTPNTCAESALVRVPLSVIRRCAPPFLPPRQIQPQGVHRSPRPAPPHPAFPGARAVLVRASATAP